jgi:hypothetical protein
MANGPLHPRRRPGGDTLVSFWLGLVVSIVSVASRLHLMIGSAHTVERIGLTDQAREFGQRIALARCWCMRVVAMIVGVIR